jgi:hypothetical protein
MGVVNWIVLLIGVGLGTVCGFLLFHTSRPSPPPFDGVNQWKSRI